MIKTNIVHPDIIEEKTSSGVYAKQDVNVIRAEGASVWDDRGKRYIDCVSGQGASNLGHGHPRLVDAMQQQMAQVLVCPELFHNPVRAEYQDMLCSITGMGRVFLCTSGTEAVEAAIKFAHLLTGRSGIVSMKEAYHGRTLGALSATWDQNIREPFDGLLQQVHYVDYNDLELLEAVLDGTIAAVLVEPIQGYGGVHVADVDYLRAVQRLCREHGIMLIVDEIQTGFGRTGSLFAYQEVGLDPDMVCLAKSIAGGLPMGAVLLNDRLGNMPLSSHGSTFGGHPMGCAAGLAVLDVLQNTNLMQRARQRGSDFMERLNASLPTDVVVDIRGRGFMIGIELDRPVKPILNELRQRGVLALSAGPNVIRLLPPLVISDEDLDTVARTIEAVLTEAAYT